MNKDQAAAQPVARRGFDEDEDEEELEAPAARPVATAHKGYELACGTTRRQRCCELEVTRDFSEPVDALDARELDDLDVRDLEDFLEYYSRELEFDELD
ncbi:hypothetical protein DFP72DRAFT_1062917 [Ephemerocybe angulata]|uniref:Uncharacterized protein n=1 Tax=Ephemerocybe angulata TaxID=980116 RepID=A0A8H6I7V4_9AGAR|nr:hypothetical protein DFP72DRAFT_1062917 [Tulosesus angulatus]